MNQQLTIQLAIAVVLLAAAAGSGAVEHSAARGPQGPHSAFHGIWRTFYDRAGKARSGPHGPCCAEEGWDDYPRMLQPWAMEVLAKRAAMLSTGTLAPTNSGSCRPDGTPTVIEIPYAFQFLLTSTHTYILYEADNQSRRIRMDSAHPPRLKPSRYGDSVGHWEGEMLVVDTVGISTKSQLNFDGIPHTDALHVVERYTVSEPGGMEEQMTLSDPGHLTGPWKMKDPGLLQLVMTVTDPGALTGPWTVIKHFHRLNESRLLEYVCAENNRDQGVPTE